MALACYACGLIEHRFRGSGNNKPNANNNKQNAEKIVIITRIPIIIIMEAITLLMICLATSWNAVEVASWLKFRTHLMNT